MYKVLTVLAAVAAISACDGLTPDMQNNPLVQPTHEYEIDTWGSNSEVYEFQSKTDPSITCIFVMLDAGNAMGLHCLK